MKRMFVAILIITGAFMPAYLASAAKSHNDQPIVSGTTKGNVGCAVLEKHMPVKGKLLFAGVVYARTEYRVLQTFNCKMPRQKFTGQGEINELNQFATKEKIKLVVIPSKHTDQELNEAVKLCHP